MNRNLPALIAALSLVFVACGTGGDTSSGVASLEEEGPANAEASTESADVVEVDSEEQLLAFSQCMRDEGIDIGDPTVDADGFVSFGGFRDTVEGDADGGRPEGFPAAIEVCGELLEGLELRGATRDLTEFQDTLLVFAQCMRDNGYDMDDPDLSTFGPGNGNEGGPGQGGGPFGDVDFSDPMFIAAQEACGDILDGFGPGGGGGGARPDQDS